MTLPNQEVYEGQFCDEMYHGVGMYIYSDGSVYEGRWHRGTRFGQGHFRSAEVPKDNLLTKYYSVKNLDDKLLF